MDNNKIFEWIAILRTRPKMIISGTEMNYRILAMYLDGYIDGLGHALNKSIRMNINRWFQNKIHVQTSYYWADYIPFHFKGKNDEELKAILLDITEEYFRENPEWYKGDAEQQ